MPHLPPTRRLSQIWACAWCIFAALAAIAVEPWMDWPSGAASLSLLPGILLGGALILSRGWGLVFLGLSMTALILVTQLRETSSLAGTALRALMLLVEVGAGVAMANWLSKPVLRLGRPSTVLLLGLALPVGLPLALATATGFAAEEGGELFAFGAPWIADAAGFLIGAPAMLLLRRRPTRLPRASIGEETAVCGLLFAALVGALLQPMPPRTGLAYLVLPFIAWELLRLSPARAGLATLASAALFAAFGAQGLGPFAAGAGVPSRLAELQLFLGASGWLLWSGILGRFSLAEARTASPPTPSRAEDPDGIARESDLLDTDKMLALGTLVSGIAHEINNPNQFIALNAPLLRELWREIRPVLDEHSLQESEYRLANLPYEEMREEVPQLIDEILQGSQRIRQIVSELRRYVSRESPVSQHELDLNRVVDSALTLLHSTIRKVTRRFDTDLAEGELVVEGNFARLQQVVINLMLNACQAMQDPDRRLRVRTSADESTGQVSVAIRDEGVGISPDHLPRITHPFFTTKREDGATGLGLAVASRIVSDHAGQLEFQSSVGEGTTVTLSLPGRRREPRTAEPPTAAAAEARHS